MSEIQPLSLPVKFVFVKFAYVRCSLTHPVHALGPRPEGGMEEEEELRVCAQSVSVVYC